MNGAPPIATERVLSTMNPDGTRRWIRPIPAFGRFYVRRQLLAWFLIVVFVGLPLIRIGPMPAVQLDILHRKFLFFGTTLLATDTLLLMLFMLMIFLGVFWITALYGRVWCGWGCPQTVYMEFLFRPIERLLEGVTGQRSTPARRAVKYAIFGVISVFLANVFLSWFVGTDALSEWIVMSPSEHPAGFAIVAITALLIFIDFAWFREQMCVVACPYARFQSVLIDRQSVIVAYDYGRGEPRGKFHRRTAEELSLSQSVQQTGDCVDCNACVKSCPTGLDIRDGFQLECVGCTQCMDACDAVMDKLKKPHKLIGYSSQEYLEQVRATKQGTFKPTPKGPRVRVVLYPALLALVTALFLYFAFNRQLADITMLRGIGAPYTVDADGYITNQIRVRVVPRVPGLHSYKLSVSGPANTRLIAPLNPLPGIADEAAQTSLFVSVPGTEFHNGKLDVVVHFDDGHGFVSAIPFRLLGP